MQNFLYILSVMRQCVNKIYEMTIV